MSDNETSGKVLPWTEEAKYQFLLRIIAQYKDAGKAINWSRVQMPGRTTKSLQNMWTKINKAVVELEAQHANGESAASTPKKATPRKRAPKKTEPVEDDEGEDEEMKDPPKKSPRKRASTGSATGRGKKVKKDESEEEHVAVKDEKDFSI